MAQRYITLLPTPSPSVLSVRRGLAYFWGVWPCCYGYTCCGMRIPSIFAKEVTQIHEGYDISWRLGGEDPCNFITLMRPAGRCPCVVRRTRTGRVMTTFTQMAAAGRQPSTPAIKASWRHAHFGNNIVVLLCRVVVDECCASALVGHRSFTRSPPRTPRANYPL